MNRGGLGDFIYFQNAINYIGENFPYVYGNLMVHPMYEPLARIWTHHNFRIITNAVEINKKWPVHVPKINHPDQMGFHQNEVGFMYYANMKVPEGWEGPPRINGDETDISQFELPEKYAVICAGGTAYNRMMTEESTIQVAMYLRTLGLTPVFLGKRHMHTDLDKKQHNTYFAGDYSELGMDLIDRTNVLEAACILARSSIVIGIDGGLLHLACCSDVPVVFGVTVASWQNRKPPPRKNPTVPVWPEYENGELLECLYCQEEWRYRYDHHFRNCILRKKEEKNKCTKFLTGKLFVKGINEALGIDNH